jgi:hypothetical protein
MKDDKEIDMGAVEGTYARWLANPKQVEQENRDRLAALCERYGTVDGMRRFLAELPGVLA